MGFSFSHGLFSKPISAGTTFGKSFGNVAKSFENIGSSAVHTAEAIAPSVMRDAAPAVGALAGAAAGSALGPVGGMVAGSVARNLTNAGASAIERANKQQRTS